MKRMGNIYPKIYEEANIRKAIIRASEHKRNKKSVKRVLDNMDEYIKRIQDLLKSKSFKNSPMAITQIYEPLSKKTRDIHKPKFYPDQIVHWCVMLQLQPLIMRGMDSHNCGNIPKRGEAHIRRYLQKAIATDYKGTKYFLKYDIHHFYQSVDHNILKAKLRRLIKDKDMLNLLDTLIDIDETGLPIGTYISQWLANYYLQALDHYTREKLGARYMFRYVDDVVILGPNKRKLNRMRKLVEEFLHNEKLEMKPNWVIAILFKRNIDFVGYQFHRNGKITIRRRIWKNIRALILRIAHHGLRLKRALRFMSYYGYIKNSNSYFIQNNYFRLLSIKKIRLSVSKGG